MKIQNKNKQINVPHNLVLSNLNILPLCSSFKIFFKFIFIYLSIFAFVHQEACGILVPSLRLELEPPLHQWKQESLNPGLSGSPLSSFSKKIDVAETLCVPVPKFTLLPPSLHPEAPHCADLSLQRIRSSHHCSM